MFLQKNITMKNIYKPIHKITCLIPIACILSFYSYILQIYCKYGSIWNMATPHSEYKIPLHYNINTVMFMLLILAFINWIKLSIKFTRFKKYSYFGSANYNIVFLIAMLLIIVTLNQSFTVWYFN